MEDLEDQLDDSYIDVDEDVNVELQR
jgi:hypothetical protein